MSWRLFPGLFALLLLAAGVSPVWAEPNDGSVTGQVVNKSAGGGSTADVTVQLISFGKKEQKPIGQRTTQTDADGRYTFSDLDRDANLIYITLARYQNVNYPGDQPFQLQDGTSQQADIAVYESTSADDGIQLESLNLMVVGADKGVLQGMEMGALVNNGDRTFVTANPQDQALAHAIKFALPSGAMNIQMQAGFSDKDVIPGLGGVQVASPVPPGRHQFAMSFELPYNGSSADVTLQVPYPTITYSVYLPDTGLKLEGSQLAAAGATQLGGQPYQLYSARNLAKSSMVSGQLSGLGGNGSFGPVQLAMISLGVVFFVLGGGVLLFGNRMRLGGTDRSAEPVPDLEQERLELVVRLAALDERYSAGEMRKAEYDRERARGKQRLRELTLARKHASPIGV